MRRAEQRDDLVHQAESLRAKMPKESPTVT